VRIATAVMFMIHGVARIVLNGVARSSIRMDFRTGSCGRGR
jgi:hypothetical protein